MPRCVTLSHLAFEDLGAFAGPLAAAGYRIETLEPGIDPLTDHDPLAADLVVVLGGPIGVYQTETYPWLTAEIAWLARRIAADRPIFGICLGAQLIAAAAGARVYPGDAGKEIGFAPITLTAAGRASCLAPFAAAPTTLHWHGDSFDLPPGATHLAATERYPNQAFALGSRIIGCQFHPEAGGPGFERWLIGHAAELSQAGVEILALRRAAARHGPALAQTAAACLHRYLDQIPPKRA